MSWVSVISPSPNFLIAYETAKHAALDKQPFARKFYGAIEIRRTHTRVVHQAFPDILAGFRYAILKHIKIFLLSGSNLGAQFAATFPGFGCSAIGTFPIAIGAGIC